MTPPREPPTAPDAMSLTTGKHGVLRVTFEPRGERTVVVDQFWRVPLQVMPPSYQDQDGQAFLYLLNPTGGIVQGDRLDVDILLRAGAKVLVTTQSATKVYRMEEDCASETNRFVVEAGGLLEYLPDQTIPYAAASFRRSTHVDAHRTATVIVGEILSAGRVARGRRSNSRASRPSSASPRTAWCDCWTGWTCGRRRGRCAHWASGRTITTMPACTWSATASRTGSSGAWRRVWRAGRMSSAARRRRRRVSS